MYFFNSYNGQPMLNRGVSPGAVVQRSDEYRVRQDEERDRLDSSD